MSAVIRTSCDAAIAKAQPAAHGISSAGLVLVTAILASSLDFIDGSVLNVGLPAIATGLNVAGADLPWVYNVYLLPLAALLLIGGAAGDLIGRRRLMVVGSAIFAAASVVAAMAPDFLVATRRARCARRRRGDGDPQQPGNSGRRLFGRGQR